MKKDPAMKMKKASMAKNKMKMVKGPDGKMVPDFAVDGKGKNDMKSSVATLKKSMATLKKSMAKLKKHFNRPRPKVLAKKMNIKLDDYEMESMKTPSYPSGHSVQGMLIAKVLSDKYPKAKSAFSKTGKNISYSRRVAHAHYKSDSKMGEKLGNSMYNHIKNKT